MKSMEWPAYRALEAVLGDLNAQIAASPGDVEAQFLRGCVLRDLGRYGESLEALERAVNLAPDHAAATVTLAAMLHRRGERLRPGTLLERLLDVHPDNPSAHLSYANVLALHDGTSARRHLERALELAPDLRAAHAALCSLLAMQGDDAAATRHRAAAFAATPLALQPYRGSRWPRPALVLLSTDGGNLATDVLLDDTIFQTTNLYVEVFEPSTQLPPHEIIVNALADADRNAAMLRRAELIVHGSAAPVINAPLAVLATGRLQLARRLSVIDGVRIPHVETFDRRSAPEFPLLLRAPGYHMGRHFAYVDDEAALDRALAALPSGDPLAIEFVDTVDADGWFWKYRVMSIGGNLYPLHLAASRSWKVHYFSSAMSEDESLRERERTFLENMSAVLGPRAMRALDEVARKMNLDYAGIDFALDRNGDIVVFEANAAMTVIPPESDVRYEYRLAPTKRILDAMANLTARCLR